MARDAWTDERLDDLKGGVDAGFRENRDEFRAVRAEMNSEFQAFRAEMKSEFQALRTEMAQQFGMQNRLMLIGFLGVIATVITQS